MHHSVRTCTKLRSSRTHRWAKPCGVALRFRAACDLTCCQSGTNAHGAGERCRKRQLAPGLQLALHGTRRVDESQVLMWRVLGGPSSIGIGRCWLWCRAAGRTRRRLVSGCCSGQHVTECWAPTIWVQRWGRPSGTELGSDGVCQKFGDSERRRLQRQVGLVAQPPCHNRTLYERRC